jgi:hypothetical protein
LLSDTLTTVTPSTNTSSHLRHSPQSVLF